MNARTIAQRELRNNIGRILRDAEAASSRSRREAAL
jgi:hypothetical protein